MSNAVLGRVSIQSSSAAAWYPVPDLQVHMRYEGCKYMNHDGRNRDRGRWGGVGGGGGFGLTSFGDGGVGGGRMCLCSYPGKEGVVPTRTTPSPPLSPPLLLMLMPFFCVGIERARSLIHSHTRTRARTHIHRYQVSWILPGILLGRSK